MFWQKSTYGIKPDSCNLAISSVIHKKQYQHSVVSVFLT